MQVLLLILVAVVLLPSDLAEPPRPWLASVVVLGGCLLLVTLAAIQARLLRRELSGRSGIRRIETIARSQRILQWSAVGLVIVGVVLLGFRSGVRNLLGDLPLLDELITISPALVTIIAAWWIYHPFDARVREATLLRRIDAGETIHPPPGRTAWVALQIRSQMLMVLVPIALLATTGEVAGMLVDRTDAQTGWLAASVPMLAFIPAVLLAPWLVVRVAGARPLPAGEIRDTLRAMCRDARVGVRDLLLWPTNGLVINAGITGLWGRWRWVMLTDGLLESLRREQLLIQDDVQYLQALGNGDAWIAVGNSDDVLSMARKSSLIGVVVPMSGTTLFADVWCVPASAARKPGGVSPLLNQWLDYTTQPARVNLRVGLRGGVSPIVFDGGGIDYASIGLSGPTGGFVDYDAAGDKNGTRGMGAKIKDFLSRGDKNHGGEIMQGGMPPDEVWARSEFLYPLSPRIKDQYNELIREWAAEASARKQKK